MIQFRSSSSHVYVDGLSPLLTLSGAVTAKRSKRGMVVIRPTGKHPSLHNVTSTTAPRAHATEFYWGFVPSMIGSVSISLRDFTISCVAVLYLLK